MAKQTRRKRRSKKTKQKQLGLLLVSVFILSVFTISYLINKNIFKNIPPNSQNKDAVAMGIDISEWQNDIDFKKIRRQGYSFVIIRTGYGWEYEDVRFKEHIENAKKAGLLVGAYHYSHATSTYQATQEAMSVMNIVDNYSLDLPIFYDIETDKQNHLSRYELTNIVSTFLTTLEDNGYTPGIYAAQSWYENRLDMSSLDQYPIWIVSYTDHLTYEGKFDYWQYTNTGSVNGIKGNCDINIKY